MNKQPGRTDFRTEKAEGERWTTDVFGLDPAPIPVSGCTSQEYFEQEMQYLYKKVWIPMGREEEILDPGSYLAVDLDCVNTSVLVVRGNDNKIRAFHNICSHRCNKLMWNQRGGAQRLYCQFHGWIYGLDGSLQNVPDQSQYFDLDKERNGLTPISCETWEGFIFVNLDPNPSQSLRDDMGEEFATGLEGYPFKEFTRCIAWKLELGCNYKIMRDAFSELCHLPYLHGKSSGASFSTKDCPVPRALAFRVFDHGGQWSMFGNPDAPLTRVREVAFKHGPGPMKLKSLMDRPPKLFNPAASSIWAGEIVQLFPSFQLSIFPDTYLYHNFVPVAVDKCIWFHRLYFREPESVGERFSQEYGAMHLRDSVLEDGRTMEYTQQVLKSGAKRHFQFSDQELLPRLNHLLTQEFAGPYPKVS